MLDDGDGLERRKPVLRTPEERASIVAQTYEPGATVCGVANKHGIVASQLSSWRTALRRKADQNKRSGSSFAEISIVGEAPPVPFDGIEVVCGAVSIRLPKSAAAKRIVDIAHRLARG
ncbi:transposase [Paracoccaceae bacterium]|nr:transposase [Paracoccaceae bacterium]